MSDDGFLVRQVPRFGRPLFRLGLSGSFGLDEAGCREALERLQYVFWTPRMKGLTPALREALALERGPLSPEEDAWMRALGRAVHG